jgi:hypothetical protein
MIAFAEPRRPYCTSWEAANASASSDCEWEAIGVVQGSTIVILVKCAEQDTATFVVDTEAEWDEAESEAEREQEQEQQIPFSSTVAPAGIGTGLLVERPEQPPSSYGHALAGMPGLPMSLTRCCPVPHVPNGARLTTKGTLYESLSVLRPSVSPE